MEKGITISLDMLGLLLAMVTDADWETENEENVATYCMAKRLKNTAIKQALT